MQLRRYLNMKFLIFFILFLSVSSQAQTQDLTGTWTFSGAGCRNATSLSADSHVSIPFSQLPVRAAILTFTSSDVTVVMAEDDGTARTETLNYTISNNQITLTGMTGAPDIHIQDNNTLISVNKGYSSTALELCCDYNYVVDWRDIKRRNPEAWKKDLEANGWDESKLIANDEESEEAKVKCRDEDNKVIAYIIGKVD